MKNRILLIRFGVVTLFLMVFFIQVSGQNLTLKQCRSMALKNNRQVMMAQKKNQKAILTQHAYFTNFLPKLSAEGLGYWTNSDAEMSLTIPGGLPPLPLGLNFNKSYLGQITLKQPIFMGGKIWSSYSMSKVGRELSRLNVEKTNQEVIYETDEAYWMTIQARELYKAALKYQETVVEFHRVVRNAVEKGMKSKNDLMKVQVRLNDAKLKVRRAENAIQLSKMNLCNIIGLPLHSKISLVGTFHFVQESIDKKATIFQRPEYSMLEKQVELKGLEKNLIRSKFLPQIAVSTSYGYLTGPTFNNQELFDKGSFSAMISVNIPLFTWGESIKKVKAAKCERTIMQLQREHLNDKMELQLQKAINDYDEALLEIDLTSRALNESAENMRMSRAQYDVGMETISDYLEAQSLWQKAQADYVIAQTKLEIAKTAYRKAAGLLTV